MNVGLMSTWRQVVSASSHLALWASLYVTGAVVCFAQVFGLEARAETLAWMLGYSFCTATAVYLLDRVKLRDRWLDPADRAAHPHRFEFLARNSAKVRVLAAVMALASAAVGCMLSPLAPVLTLAACVG